jgi:hypothetical protein
MTDKEWIDRIDRCNDPIELLNMIGEDLYVFNDPYYDHIAQAFRRAIERVTVAPVQPGSTVVGYSSTTSAREES